MSSNAVVKKKQIYAHILLLQTNKNVVTPQKYDNVFWKGLVKTKSKYVFSERMEERQSYEPHTHYCLSPSEV